jgi:EmrB/QacA subfamily drug resistance transporter
VSSPAPAPQTQQQGVRVIFGALILVFLLASLDQTIVSTALPTIVGELGGLQHLSWVVTAYLLASTVSGPLYGKFGDLYGRKIVMQTAIVIFLAGSVLCGLSQNMAELIGFRALQGLGAGGLIVTAIAVVGDVIPPRDRGRYQGIFGAVFGVSTIIGPLLGGFFVDNLSWRWIFYVNLPVGAIAFIVIGAAFRSRAVTKQHEIDYLGAALLAGGLSAVVLFTSLGGTTWAWDSAQIIALIVIGIVSLAAFTFVESRVAEPILPLALFRNRTFAVTSAVGFIVGLSLFGAVTYLPLYLQIVKGVSPTKSGLQLTPMMLGLLVTSVASGQLITRWGKYRIFPIIGTAVVSVGMLLLSRLGIGSSLWVAALDMVVLGLGLGMVMQVLVLAVQNAVPYRYLGVATSGSTMFRSIGGSIGVSLFGAIFANRLQTELAQRLPPSVHLPSTTSPATIRALPSGVRDSYIHALTAALSPVFTVAAVLSFASFVLALLLPDIPLKRTSEAEGVGETFATPRNADSERELERVLGVIARREERWRAYEELAANARIDLPPTELWALARLGERAPAPHEAIAAATGVDDARLRRALDELERRGLVRELDGAYTLTPDGQRVFGTVVAVRRATLEELVRDWSPEDHAQLSGVLDRLARSLASEMPTPA